MTIADNDRVIAGFMGEKMLTSDFHLKKYKRVCVVDGKNGYLIKEYSKDWKLLMSVVEKIETIRFNWSCNYTVKIEGPECKIYMDDLYKGGLFIENTEKTKIKAVYKTVVEFIKWHNKNK